jgi:outer membrane protein insertion porin family
MQRADKKRMAQVFSGVLLGILIAGSSLPMQAQAQAEAQAEKEGKTLVQPPAATDSATARGPVVKEVEIEYAGPRSVDRSVILSNMRTTVGQPYSLIAVEEDVRNLYATGLFVNLRIYDEPIADGVKVVVIVQPKPTVKDLIIIGAEKIKEKRVRKEMTSKPGDPLSEQKIAEDSRKILEYYRSKGFSKATVEYKIDINEQAGRAVVTFTIAEEGKAHVRYVNFEGHTVFTDKELRKVFKTRKKDWLSFFNKSGLLKEEQVKEDLKALKDHYQKNGYIDMQVKDVAYTYPEEDVIDIKVTIFEGIQYRVGRINFEKNQLFTSEQIMGRIRASAGMAEGGVFSPQGLETDVRTIRDLYGERGYIDAEVSPVRQPNIASGKMDILYSVSENDQSFVERIIVQGNNRTKDKVLRRELAVAPGEVYDSVRVDASKKRLENLGYFSKVDVSAQDTAVPNRKDMVVTVEEQRTGSVTFGVGFSTVDSLLGFVELSQSNFDFANFPSFTGAGQKFRTRLQYGLTRRDFLVSWTEPWFLDRQLSFGFDLFYNQSSFNSSLYDIERYGAAIRVGKALNQFWRLGLRYQAENIGIVDVDTAASPALRAEQGFRTKSSVRATLTYDSRDDLFLTRNGEKVEFSAEGAGGPLLGDTDIWKLEMEATKYFQLPYDFILSLGAASAVVDGYDDTAIPPLFDRLFIGGSRSIRGFNFRDVGPRDAAGEPFGGQTSANANAEITFPIIDRVRGAVFVDGGFNNARVFDYSLNNFAIGTGVGLRLNLPIGPLRLDLGTPLMENSDFDPTGSIKFHFDVGYQF